MILFDGPLGGGVGPGTGWISAIALVEQKAQMQTGGSKPPS